MKIDGETRSEGGISSRKHGVTYRWWWWCGGGGVVVPEKEEKRREFKTEERDI